MIFTVIITITDKIASTTNLNAGLAKKPKYFFDVDQKCSLRLCRLKNR
jgi:hypothetical protein